MRLQGGKEEGNGSLRPVLLRSGRASVKTMQCDLTQTKLLNPHLLLCLCLLTPIPVSIGKLLHCCCGVERFRTIARPEEDWKGSPPGGDDAPLPRRTKRAKEKSFSTCGQDSSLALLTVSGQSPLEGQG
jgi:hypothetical protein